MDVSSRQLVCTVPVLVASSFQADATIDPSRTPRRTTLIPYEEYTPRNLWSKVAAPDPRFWAATGVYNVPMNLTWVNGTMYTVRRCAICHEAVVHGAMSLQPVAVAEERAHGGRAWQRVEGHEHEHEGADALQRTARTRWSAASRACRPPPSSPERLSCSRSAAQRRGSKPQPV